MKILTNPLRTNESAGYVKIRDHLQSMDGILGRASAALEKQKAILDKMQKSVNVPGQKQEKERTMNALVDELDGVVNACRLGKRSLLDGSFSKGMCYASLWFHCGIEAYNRKRIYIATMHSRALMLKNFNGGLNFSFENSDSSKRTGTLILRRAREKVDYQSDVLGAYRTRIGYVRSFVTKVFLEEFAKTPLERGVRGNQARLLRAADQSMRSMHEIVQRLKELTVRAGSMSCTMIGLYDKRDSLYRNAASYKGHAVSQMVEEIYIGAASITSRSIGLQLEVSALVNEVDRISSQAEFNRMRLFRFTRNEPLCLVGAGRDGIDKVYFKTMSARGLRLIENGWKIALDLPGLVTIDGTRKKTDCQRDYEKMISTLDQALLTIQGERSKIKAYIAPGAEKPEFDRNVSVSKK